MNIEADMYLAEIRIADIRQKLIQALIIKILYYCNLIR